MAIFKFSNVKKKVWVYVYRCKRVCEASDVKEFILQKPSFNDLQINVHELTTDDKNNKCFVVSAPYHMKDEMYKPEFWPKSVGFKRFDLFDGKYKQYNQGNFL
ncbi:hypothetical protein NQ314_014370 [Rhamnusium bicolor]|uniref:Uncharacterized protein n=1 Tax=Rhamnusium bicolor TaxID=1586634 RepID=A0AAV8X1U3_9CUCU|nr:hypothetical protein NQ314_014370 [Rhamnusium bicolor]